MDYTYKWKIQNNIFLNEKNSQVYLIDFLLYINPLARNVIKVQVKVQKWIYKLKISSAPCKY